MSFTNEEIKQLAKSEQEMDSGKIPFVILSNNRVIMSDEGMKEFGLIQGQSINNDIFIAILKFNISRCEAKIISDKIFKDAAVNEN